MMEYCLGGSLYDLIHHRRRERRTRDDRELGISRVSFEEFPSRDWLEPLSWDQRLKVALDIAEGMVSARHLSTGLA